MSTDEPSVSEFIDALIETITEEASENSEIDMDLIRMDVLRTKVTTKIEEFDRQWKNTELTNDKEEHNYRIQVLPSFIHEVGRLFFPGFDVAKHPICVFDCCVEYVYPSAYNTMYKLLYERYDVEYYD